MSRPAAARLGVIVCALNEAAYLPALLTSIDAQSRQPDELLLVDDGSHDGTWDLVVAYCRRRPFALPLRRERRPAERDRLATAAELQAFFWALERLRTPCDVVAKIDADLVLARDHFERMMSEFAREPRLGIAGAYLAVPCPGGVRRELHIAEHVRGANKFYRRACLQAIQPIEPILGWDTFDDAAARAQGWMTRSFPLSTGDSLHVRPTGSYDGPVRGAVRWGRAAYAAGSPFPAVVASALLRFTSRPVGAVSAALVYGWAAGAVGRAPRAPALVRTSYRREQYRRLIRARRTIGSRRRRTPSLR